MSSLPLTLGALEAGTLISSVLYGVVTVQTFLYVERSFQDPLWLRLVVALVWILETVHTIFTWVLLYTLTVTNYGIPSTIGETHQYWPLCAALICSALVGAVVQSFFGYRVRVLSAGLVIPSIVWFGGIIRVVFAIILVKLLLSVQTIPEFLRRFQWGVTIELVLPAVIDLLNTSALCFYLSRRRSGFKSTQRKIDRLMIFTIETGLLTSLCAVAQVICSFVMPNNLVLWALLIIYPKLFSNSFFTSLNTRKALRQTGSEPPHVWSTDGSHSNQLSTDRGVSLEFTPRRPAPPPHSHLQAASAPFFFLSDSRDGSLTFAGVKKIPAHVHAEQEPPSPMFDDDPAKVITIS